MDGLLEEGAVVETARVIAACPGTYQLVDAFRVGEKKSLGYHMSKGDRLAAQFGC